MWAEFPYSWVRGTFGSSFPHHSTAAAQCQPELTTSQLLHAATAQSITCGVEKWDEHYTWLQYCLFFGSNMWAYIQHIFLSLLKNVPYDSVFHLNINPNFQPFHLLSMTININYQMQPWIFAKIGFIKWNSCYSFKDKSLISCLQNNNSVPMVFSTSDKESSTRSRSWNV